VAVSEFLDLAQLVPLIGQLFINRQRVIRVVMISADLEMGHHVPNVDHPR